MAKPDDQPLATAPGSPSRARPPAGPAVVQDVGLLVHLGADAVPAVLLDDPVAALGPDVRLDGVADVGDAASEPGRGEAAPHRLLADPQQLSDLAGHLTHGDGARRVAAPSVQDRPAVDGDDVAVLQGARAGDAVHDLVVDRGADRA